MKLLPTGPRLIACCVASLCLMAPVRGDPAVDDWRGEAARVRQLAENDALQAYERAQALQARLPTDAAAADRARALNLLARVEIYLAKTDDAARHAQQALDLAERNADRVGQAEADLNIALNSVNQGRIDDLVGATNHVLSVLDGVDRPDLMGEALLRKSMLYRRVGRFDDSVTNGDAGNGDCAPQQGSAGADLRGPGFGHLVRAKRAFCGR
jgi:tetratricopeptide (TPR) repeat protein